MRDAGADRDRPGEHIAVMDMPAFVAGFRIAAAGEGGHGAIKARSDQRVES
jgi:hypothetical protein